ncbi:hypothetical protein Holit_02568 [Hollandina sp. SP2]
MDFQLICVKAGTVNQFYIIPQIKSGSRNLDGFNSFTITRVKVFIAVLFYCLLGKSFAFQDFIAFIIERDNRFCRISFCTTYQLTR